MARASALAALLAATLSAATAQDISAQGGMYYPYGSAVGPFYGCARARPRRPPPSSTPRLTRPARPPPPRRSAGPVGVVGPFGGVDVLGYTPAVSFGGASRFFPAGYRGGVYGGGVARRGFYRGGRRYLREVDERSFPLATSPALAPFPALAPSPRLETTSMMPAGRCGKSSPRETTCRTSADSSSGTSRGGRHPRRSQRLRGCRKTTRRTPARRVHVRPRRSGRGSPPKPKHGRVLRRHAVRAHGRRRQGARPIPPTNGRDPRRGAKSPANANATDADALRMLGAGNVTAAANLVAYHVIPDRRLRMPDLEVDELLTTALGGGGEAALREGPRRPRRRLRRRRRRAMRRFAARDRARVSSEARSTRVTVPCSSSTEFCCPWTPTGCWMSDRRRTRR